MIVDRSSSEAVVIDDRLGKCSSDVNSVTVSWEQIYCSAICLLLSKRHAINIMYSGVIPALHLECLTLEVARL